MPWGIRVPLELDLALGTPLFVKRCTALLRDVFRPEPVPAGVTVRRAGAADIDLYADLELAAFGGDRRTELQWLSPAMGAAGFGHWIAERDGHAIAGVATVRTDARAGPATYLTGLTESADANLARGFVSAAVSAAFDSGTMLVHFNPNEQELALLAPLAFVEVPGFLVRVVRSDP